MVAEGLKFVRNLIRESRRFGPARAEDREKLAAEASRLSRKYDVAVSGSRLVAIRDMEVALESQAGGVRALRYGAEMLAASRAGEPVVAIAERLRVPPVAALRQILLELGHSAAAVRAMIADSAQMPPRLAREAPAVFEADLGSRLNADRIRARSQAYEDALGAHLRRLGLRRRRRLCLRRRRRRHPDRGRWRSHEGPQVSGSPAQHHRHPAFAHPRGAGCRFLQSLISGAPAIASVSG
jgi:hypothetical protein